MEKEIKELVYSMLIENTGIHMLDSGFDNGRHWQQNQTKTLEDFEKEPSVDFDATDVTQSTEIELSISVFHYLTNGGLELDDLCREYNASHCDDWDGDYYGVSTEQMKWLNKNMFEQEHEQSSFNTYNGESNLSQVLQGTVLRRGVDHYVLLQVHGGADVRGGYTDAKLFYLPEEYMPSEIVNGTIDGVYVDTGYNGYSLTDDNGEPVPVTSNSKIELSL